MAEESEFIKQQRSKWLRELDIKRRPYWADRQANSFEAFLEEIEFEECYPENEHLAKKIIDTLKQKYNLIF